MRELSTLTSHAPFPLFSSPPHTPSPATLPYLPQPLPTLSHSRSPVDSMREAVLTVSPNRQYRGMVRPTTPATHGPAKMHGVDGRARIGQKLAAGWHLGPRETLASHNLHRLPKDTLSIISSQLQRSAWYAKMASRQATLPPTPRVCLLSGKFEAWPWGGSWT